MRRRWHLWALALMLAGCGGSHTGSARAAPAPPVRHVFVIVLENESAGETFGAGSPAPYLAQTLRSQGAFLPNYHATGHESNDNYISMISGQAPNIQNQADCQNFDDFVPATIGALGQVQGSGCVYPPSVQTVASQLSSAGFTWEDYNQDMGADPSRESAVCAHPAIGATDNTQKATPKDQYATRHNPFVYFHSIIDDTTLCDTHVVGLDRLPQALATAAATPNYVFITPNLCDDGHDAPCANGDSGGLAQADGFLRTWVPQITGSPAFRQNGLLIVTFDEASSSDASACCGEIPGPGSPVAGITGPGGGDVGAVLLSPCIAPGTVSNVPYNHYSMLRSIEDMFGLSHLGYAQLAGEATFGSDIFNRPCKTAAPRASIHAPPLLSSVSSRARIPLRWSATTAAGTPSSYTLRVRDTSARRPRWRAIARATHRTSLTFKAVLGHTYEFAVQGVDQGGETSPRAGATVVVPSGCRPARARFSRGGWHVHKVRGAWQGHAISSSRKGATFSLRYRGATVSLIGERSTRGGAARVTVDGRSRTVGLHASRRWTRRVLFRAKLRSRLHRLELRVLRGPVALEGVAIASRRA